MKMYLLDIPLPDAKARFVEALIGAGLWERLGTELIALDEWAVGRVLAEPVWAKMSSPHYHAAAMDGFAVKSIDTSGALLTAPTTLLIGERATSGRAQPAIAIYVDTGDLMPGWADAVIPIENVEPINHDGTAADDIRNPHAIRIREAVTPWHHVRPMGEDIVATELVLPAGHTVRPVDLGAIAASGHDTLAVARKPKVAIIPTGSELIEVGENVTPGDIIEYNSIILASQVIEWGGKAARLPITPDVVEEIRKVVMEAAEENDLILLNAGSSAGSEDFSAQVIDSLGDLLVHGVAIRPGHPVILGMINHQKTTSSEIDDQGTKVPILGVPGYPVSAAITGEIFVEPLLSKWLGRKPYEYDSIPAYLARKVTSPPGDDDYMRVAVGRVGEKMMAAPLSRGAGVITSLSRADGLVVIPRGSQGMQSGTQVNVRLYRPVSELERTIFVIGSHDMTLDLMSQYLVEGNRRITSSNVGSLAGIVALKRGEAHVCGSHLLDPESGVYNLSYIDEYLPGVPVKVLEFVNREQGIMVRKGNPKFIISLEDLNRPDITFINRQRGAGTRVLLDYQLRISGIESNEINGYDMEEYTHLAVASAVSSGRADCGLGIAAAAQALELDFIPLYKEKYELIIPSEYYESELLAPMLSVLQNEEFRNAVSNMPGYDVNSMGKLVYEVE
jgi:putative molybdopterin biosynthesis protein